MKIIKKKEKINIVDDTLYAIIIISCIFLFSASSVLSIHFFGNNIFNFIFCFIVTLFSSGVAALLIKYVDATTIKTKETLVNGKDKYDVTKLRFDDGNR